MNHDVPPKQRLAVPTSLAGVLGGLVVLVVGAILIATDVIDTGDTTTASCARRRSRSRRANTGADAAAARPSHDIYKQEGRGVVFIQAEGVTTRATRPFGCPSSSRARPPARASWSTSSGTSSPTPTWSRAPKT